MQRSVDILSLIQSTLAGLDKSDHVLSATIRSSIRICHLSEDSLNRWWLEWELFGHDDYESRRRAFRDALEILDKERFNFWQQRYNDLWKRERRVGPAGKSDNDDYKLLPYSIFELERNRASIVDEFNEIPDLDKMFSSPNFAAPQLQQRRTFLRQELDNYSDVLRRIEQRVFDFLITAEKKLLFGASAASVFERYRNIVDNTLSALSPDALASLTAAYQRITEGDIEARSHALTSCRRVLKALADAVFPAQDQPITGDDGKMHSVTDDAYVNRLRQFISSAQPRTASANIIKTSVKDLGARLDAVNSLANKGAHAIVSDFEAYQCVIQTYLIVGDVLQLRHE